MANVPPKPWPQGMSKEIAKKMGVSNKAIDRAIGALIKAGRLEPSIPQIAALPAASPNSANGETQKIEAGTPS